MPHANVIWRATPTLPKSEIRKLVRALPGICAGALCVPGRHEYVPLSVTVRGVRQGEFEVNMPPLYIMVFATGSAQQLARRDEARRLIVNGINELLGQQVVDMGSVWLLLPETSFGKL